MDRLVTLPLLLLILIFFNVSHSQELCNPHDKSVLFRIKNFWGNPSALSYWDPNADCCQWNYMICDDQGHISTFRISLADVHGPIPPFLDELPSLTYLQFDNMYNLSGPIPSYIGKLTNLTTLVIAGTNIRGTIPSFLAQLTSLTRLELRSNKHTGLVPDFLTQLKSLTYLALSDNRLTGSIPLVLAQLSKLNSLYLNSNKLSGPIPDFPIVQLQNLLDLELQFNQLSGSIPKSYGQYPNLTIIMLRHNKLTGDASFLLDKKDAPIKYVDLSYNNLKFDFTNVDLSRNIIELRLSHNKIYGSLPLKFGLFDPDEVDVSYNQLCGPIPNGRRFKRATPTIFAHNKCLCGGPLPPCKSS